MGAALVVVMVVVVRSVATEAQANPVGWWSVGWIVAADRVVASVCSVVHVWVVRVVDGTVMVVVMVLSRDSQRQRGQCTDQCDDYCEPGHFLFPS